MPFRLVGLLALTGCLAHEDIGDAAVARSDWQAAAKAYDIALEWGVDSPRLRSKRRLVRGMLDANQRSFVDVDPVSRHHSFIAREELLRCAAARDWKCCRDKARRLVSLGEHSNAASYLTAASQAAGPAAMTNLAAAVSDIVVEAQRALDARDFDEAIALLELATAADAQQRWQLDYARRTADVARADAAVDDALRCLVSNDAQCARKACDTALAAIPSTPRARAIAALIDGSADTALVRLAVAEAQALREGGAWTYAIAMLQLIVQRDPAQQRVLTDVREEYERVLAAQYRPSWKRYCASCHGEDGAADTKMGRGERIRDFRETEWQQAATDAQLETIIREGRPNTKMRAFSRRISPDEVRGLVAVIRSFSAARPRAPAAIR